MNGDIWVYNGCIIRVNAKSSIKAALGRKGLQSFDVYERFKKKTEFPKYLSLTLSCLTGPFLFLPSLATAKTHLAKMGSDRPNSTLICYDILLNGTKTGLYSTFFGYYSTNLVIFTHALGVFTRNTL